MKIYILRHGETTLNSKGVTQGWLDEPLNENGDICCVIGVLKSIRKQLGKSDGDTVDVKIREI